MSFLPVDYDFIRDSLIKVPFLPLQCLPGIGSPLRGSGSEFEAAESSLGPVLPK